MAPEPRFEFITIGKFIRHSQVGLQRLPLQDEKPRDKTRKHNEFLGAPKQSKRGSHRVANHNSAPSESYTRYRSGRDLRSTGEAIE